MELDAADKANIHYLDMNVSQGLRLNDSTENKELAEIALLKPEGSDLDHHRTEVQQEQQNHGEDQQVQGGAAVLSHSGFLSHLQTFMGNIYMIYFQTQVNGLVYV